MSTSVENPARTLTISLPEPLASEAEALARAENLDLSEFFRRALRSYQIDRLHKQIVLAHPAVLIEEEEARMQEINAYIEKMRQEANTAFFHLPSTETGSLDQRMDGYQLRAIS